MLALLSKNNCYNTTHVHSGNAFENALIEASLLLKEDASNHILIGDVEELSPYNIQLDTKRKRFKKKPVSNTDLVRSKTKGSVSGEGASMFLLSSSSKNALAKIVDLKTFFKPNQKELIQHCKDFLAEKKMSLDSIDLLVLGYNGNSEENTNYDCFLDLFKNSKAIAYKHMVGDYSTSSSFAVYMSLSFLNGIEIPSHLALNNNNRKTQRVLIYNHYQNVHHSFILLESVRD
jgi:hypothetical protein